MRDKTLASSLRETSSSRFETREVGSSDDHEHGSKVDESDEQKAASLLEEVERLKNKGNVEFHKGRTLVKHTAGKNLLSNACMLYVEAIQAFSKAEASIKRLEAHYTAVESQPMSSKGHPGDRINTNISSLSKRSDTLRPSLFLNLAACNLLLNEWSAAIACCTEVLERCGAGIIAAVASVAESTSDGSNTANVQEAESDGLWCKEMAAKALYRRSSARVGESDLGLAREDLVLAKRLKPGDVNIRRELKKVEKLIAELDAKERLNRETEDGRRRHRLKQEQDRASCSSKTTAFLNTKTEIISSGLSSDSASKNTSSQYDGHGQGPREKTDQAIESNDGGGGDIEEYVRDSVPLREDEPPVTDVDDFPTTNGGVCRNGLYAWSQSIYEVQVCIKVPDWVHAKNIRVDFRRSRLTVTGRRVGSGEGTPNKRSEPKHLSNTVVGESDEVIILAGPLSRPIQIDECVWTMERHRSVVLYLQKELSPDGDPGFEWWATVLEGDSEIDVLKCDAGSDVSQYPEYARRRGAKALWDHEQKTPEERREKERMREARRQMEEEVEERRRSVENALKDPKKAEIYRKLQEVMPDIPISIK